jgi:AraC-like DNA-binding protein
MRSSAANAPLSTYRELEPPAAFRDLLVCTWTQVVNEEAGDFLHRVLPDGCADLVWIGDAPAVVAGPATRWVDKRLPPRTTIVGVRLRPGRVPEGLGLPASELLDREVCLQEVWGRAADELTDRASQAPTYEAKIERILEALGARWNRLARTDPTLPFAVRWLTAHPQARVTALSATLGLSARQLQRRFVAAVGYGPKSFQRIVRFQRLLEIAMRRLGSPAGAMALEAGYSDQAHMSRDVTRLAGRTPAAMLGRVDSTLRLFRTGG